MAVITYNLEVDQGATYSKKFVWKDSTGTPYNLTTYSARMQIRRSVGASSFMVELTTANGGIVLGGALGTIEIVISETNSKLLTGDGVYDLELVNGPIVTRFAEGSVVLSKEVTRE